MQASISRELQTSGRRSSFYFGRFACGLSGLLLFLGIYLKVAIESQRVWGFAGSITSLGSQTFGLLSVFIFLAILTYAPLLSADAISRERREGTLPLLLLTPLTFTEILLAKSIFGALQALALTAALIPVMYIPALLGGVTGLDLARTTGLWVSALVVGVASGIYASTVSDRRIMCSIVALGLSVLGGVVVSLGYFFGYQIWISTTGFTDWLVWGGISLSGVLWVAVWAPRKWAIGLRGGVFLLFLGLALLALSVMVAPHRTASGFLYLLDVAVENGLDKMGDAARNLDVFRLSQFLTLGGGWWADRLEGANPTSVRAVGMSSIAALGFAGLLVASARLRLEGYLRTRSQPAWWTRLSSPLTRPLVKRAGSPVSTRFPMLWADGRHWKARLAKWMLLGVTMVAVSSALATGSSVGLLVAPTCALLAVAVIGASAFRGEASSGVLELLLVTPLSPRALVWTRVASVARNIGLSFLLALYAHASLYDVLFMGGAPSIGPLTWSPLALILFSPVPFAWTWLSQLWLTLALAFWFSFQGRSYVFSVVVPFLTTLILAPGCAAVWSWGLGLACEGLGLDGGPFIRSLPFWFRLEAPLAIGVLLVLEERIRQRRFVGLRQSE